MEPPSEKEPSDNKVTYGRCRCCCQQGPVKEMWTEYRCEGLPEIYGEMIMDTFALDLTADGDFICELCVLRLRDAHRFKCEVLAGEKYIEEELTVVKIEESSDEEIESESYVVEEMVDGKLEYFEIEYLEDEEEKQGLLVISENKASPTHKQVKRRKAEGDQKRVNKNYTEEDMRQCVEAIVNDGISIAAASQLYNIPRKTVQTKVQQYATKKEPETPEEIEKALYLEKQYNFKNEIKAILTHTNAMPFKVRAGRYVCAYCYTSSECFDDPEELRIHAMKHEHERIDKVDFILRPYFLNEILRVDIKNFCCLECNEPIRSWNDMFKHLKSQHDVELDQTYNRLIPYNLDKDFLHCALCETKFPNFCYLDCHMNAHYTNYMCSECGETFVAEARLKHHLQIHNTGRFPCEECGKVFSLEKYVRRHVSMVHKRVKCLKCLYCAEKFVSDYIRHTHVRELHKEKVQVISCEYCSKKFDWRPFYMAHLRKVHSKNKKNKCRYCHKGFVTKHEVKMHELRHTGQGAHVCDDCGKNFVTKAELRSHSKRHIKEKKKRILGV